MHQKKSITENKTKHMKFRASTVILILNIIIFISLSITSRFHEEAALPLICWNLGSGLFNPYQLITSQFLHADIIHLGLNMLLFMACAEDVEDEIGGKRFTIYYLVCGIMATLSHIAFSKFPVIGASGAIWGILVMWAFLKPKKSIELIFFNWKIPLRTLVIVLFLIEISLLIFDRKSNVSNLAHIGGALTGFILILLYQISKDKKNLSE
jgi:membrane associated rhomboid family serine protease